MDPSNLLSQLRDVQPPSPITLWPLAPGWWVLIILSVLLIAALFYYLVTKWRKSEWKRQALKQLDILEQQHDSQASGASLLDLNKLLKQSISSAYGTRSYLQLCEHEWAHTLQSVNHKNRPVLNEEDIKLLTHDIYSNQSISFDSAIFKRLSLWIKQLG